MKKLTTIPAPTPPTKGRRLVKRGGKALFSPELKALLESSDKPNTQTPQPNPATVEGAKVRFNLD